MRYYVVIMVKETNRGQAMGDRGNVFSEQEVKNRAGYGNWVGPKSLCTCGHSGDGADSCHTGIVLDGTDFELKGNTKIVLPDDGHGRCEVVGCKCERFRWARWFPPLKALFKKHKKHLNLDV